jgi:hypothetical protein
MKAILLKIVNYLITLLALATLCSCCSGPKLKTHPEYKGVDPTLKPYVDEYLGLSTRKNIKFFHDVTVGFKKINYGNVVGICNYGLNWREIDVDSDFWNNATSASKLAMLFHELTHCYCTRGHDYGKNLDYPETEGARIARALQWQQEGGPRPGYWDDGCPTSLTYPVVVDDNCLYAHYNQYIDEMFDRCRSW